MAQRAGRVGEPDRREPIVRLLGREHALIGGQRGDRRQQGAIEEADMDVAHLPLDRLPHLPQRVAGVGQAGAAGEGPQLLRAGGHQVGAPQIAQLHPVLEQSEGAVVAGERRRLGPADVALGDEGVERREGAALTDPIIGQAVHELEQLHGELDVADAAGAELDLVGDLAGGNVLGDPLAHALHAVDEVLARGARPDLGLNGGHVRLAELQVSGDRAGLQQRLELPALGPAVVVRQVRREGAHERALLALRPEVGIDLPERRLDLHRRDPAHQLHGEPGRDVDDPALPDLVDRAPGRRRRRR